MNLLLQRYSTEEDACILESKSTLLSTAFMFAHGRTSAEREYWGGRYACNCNCLVKNPNVSMKYIVVIRRTPCVQGCDWLAETLSESAAIDNESVASSLYVMILCIPQCLLVRTQYSVH